MTELIKEALDKAYDLTVKATPTTKKVIKSISIIDIKPSELQTFIKDNNIPDNAWFDVKDNGYDAWECNDILLSWDVEIPITQKDKLEFCRKYFDHISFRKVYEVFISNGYRRRGSNTTSLKEFKDTTRYDMYINMEWERLVKYFSLYYIKS